VRHHVRRGVAQKIEALLVMVAQRTQRSLARHVLINVAQLSAEQYSHRVSLRALSQQSDDVGDRDFGLFEGTVGPVG
jgi:hypothetical protein